MRSLEDITDSVLKMNSLTPIELEELSGELCLLAAVTFDCLYGTTPSTPLSNIFFYLCAVARKNEVDKTKICELFHTFANSYYITDIDTPNRNQAIVLTTQERLNKLSNGLVKKCFQYFLNVWSQTFHEVIDLTVSREKKAPIKSDFSFYSLAPKDFIAPKAKSSPQVRTEDPLPPETKKKLQSFLQKKMDPEQAKTIPLETLPVQKEEPRYNTRKRRIEDAPENINSFFQKPIPKIKLHLINKPVKKRRVSLAPTNFYALDTDATKSFIAFTENIGNSYKQVNKLCRR